MPFFSYSGIIFHCVYVSYFHNPSISWWTARLSISWLLWTKHQWTWVSKYLCSKTQSLWDYDLEYCGGFNKNAPYSLIYLNIWSPLSDTIWEGFGELRVVALLEEVCLWGWTLRFQKPTPRLSISSLFLFYKPGCSSCLVLHIYLLPCCLPC